MGLEEVGFECVGYIERSKAARRAYLDIHGKTGLWNATDIERVNTRRLQELSTQTEVELLCGGLPSIERPVDRGGGDFIKHALVVGRKLKTKSLLFSTTVNTIGHDGGKTLKAIVEWVSEAGYRVDYEVLDSRYFGVPQGRSRLYIVAVREDLVESKEWVIYGNTQVPRSKREISKNQAVKTFNFNWNETGTGREKLEGVLENVVNDKYFLTGDRLAAIANQMSVYEGHVEDGLNPVLVVKEATLKGYSLAEEGDSINISYPGSETRRGRVGKDVANTVLTSASQGVAVRRGDTEEYTIRELTPRENWRLQGIKDAAFDRVCRTRSDSELYGYAGNTVTVGVISAIGEELSKIIRYCG